MKIDHEFTDNIICPYCGYEWKDSWEISRDNGDMECNSCGENFAYERIVSVDYSTYKDEKNCEHVGSIYCDECGAKI